MNTFDFQEALSYIKAGLSVSINIDNRKRTYKLNDNGNIICIPNEKEFLSYKVKHFHIDAIMSNEWQLCN
jgi:hypothetical protein